MCNTDLETHVDHLIYGHLACVSTAALEVAVLRRNHDAGREVLVNHADVEVGRAHVHIALVQQIRARLEVRNKLGELRGLCRVALPVATNNRLAAVTRTSQEMSLQDMSLPHPADPPPLAVSALVGQRQQRQGHSHSHVLMARDISSMLVAQRIALPDCPREVQDTRRTHSPHLVLVNARVQTLVCPKRRGGAESVQNSYHWTCTVVGISVELTY